MKNIFLAFGLLLILSPKTALSQIVDIDGNEYKTVIINNQNWMSENLNVSHFSNGDIIPQVQDLNKWNRLKTPAWCYYENNSGEGKTYGKLYNWYAITDPRGLAPQGWYIPSENEFKLLSDYLGGDVVSGLKLKSSTGWKSYFGSNGNGDNQSGFNGIAAGHTSIMGCVNLYYMTGFWSSSIQSDFNSPLYFGLSGDGNSLLKGFGEKESGFSVRCLKN